MDGWVEFELLISAASTDAQRGIGLGRLKFECHIDEGFGIG
jgi:hypothetical protein